MSGKTFEYCCWCDELTGRAGRHDDSLYLPDGTGPMCVTCHEAALAGIRKGLEMAADWCRTAEEDIRSQGYGPYDQGKEHAYEIATDAIRNIQKELEGE